MAIGWHVSRADFARYLGLDSDDVLPTAQIFLRSPRSGFAEPKMGDRDRDLVAAYGAARPLFVHAPYTINIFKSGTPAAVAKAAKALSMDIAFAIELDAGIRGIVIHEASVKNSASPKGEEIVAAARAIARAYEMAGVKKGDRGVPKILVENTTKGRDIDGFCALVSGIRSALREMDLDYIAAKVAVCYDTQHAFSRGLRNEGGEVVSDKARAEELILAELVTIEERCGKNALELVHFNDSLVAAGSTVDRHETPGLGLAMDAGTALELAGIFRGLDVNAVVERPDVDKDLVSDWNR